MACKQVSTNDEKLLNRLLAELAKELAVLINDGHNFRLTINASPTKDDAEFEIVKKIKLN